MRNKNIKTTLAAVALAASLAPLFAVAATTPLKYEAWLPFWKKQEGASEIALRLLKFNGISPFSYEVNPDGTLKDSLKIDEGFWPEWFRTVRALKVKIIPTVALLDGDAIYNLLSDAALRRQHATNIVSMVKAEKFDGVDVDYEDKSAATKPYFSLFINGLSSKLHAAGKTLICTIEGRTPVDSRFSVAPKDLTYANDYAAINKYCDEVRIMAYDQGTIDLKLDAAKGSSSLYMPVADPDWVEKVIQETTPTISRNKIMLGVPTYGYIYEVSWNNNLTTYKRLAAIAYQKALDLAKAVGATPLRNSAGEMSFTYATSTPMSVSAGLTFTVSSTLPAGLWPASSSSAVTRFVSFTDASAINDKIALAKKYKLRGVVFFKMDGETDPALWTQTQ